MLSDKKPGKFQMQVQWVKVSSDRRFLEKHLDDRGNPFRRWTCDALEDGSRNDVRDVRINHNLAGISRGKKYEGIRRVNLKRSSDANQDVRLRDNLGGNFHSGHILAKPDHVGSELASEGALVAESDVGFSQVLRLRWIAGAAGDHDLAVQV
jgi:hypothetical protein